MVQRCVLCKHCLKGQCMELDKPLKNKYRHRKNNCIRFSMDPVRIFEEDEDGEDEQGEG